MQLMRLAYGRRVSELKGWAENNARLTRDMLNAQLKYFLRLTRESFMYNFHQKQLNYLTPEEENFVAKFAPFINERNIADMAQLFETSRKHIAQNTNSHIVLFDMAMNVILLLRR